MRLKQDVLESEGRLAYEFPSGLTVRIHLEKFEHGSAIFTVDFWYKDAWLYANPAKNHRDARGLTEDDVQDILDRAIAWTPEVLDSWMQRL